jgi:1,4-alpha-glucan branching enzyme
MKKIYLLFLLLTSFVGAKAFDVTFRVDMNGTGLSNVSINGTFNNWCGYCAPMTDANSDGVWEITLPLAAGNYEYKFTANSGGSWENLAPGSSCTVTNFGFTNRSLAVSANATLPTVCWQSCVSCSQAPASYPVTFQVDMTNVSGFTTPTVNGSFDGWCGNCHPLTDANADGVWETTLSLPAGTYEYKFAYDNWAGQENLIAGSSCTVTNSGYTNRTVTVSAAATLPTVCWASCVACSQVPPSYTVTFKVNMQGQIGFTTPEVNGTFNNWCGNCNPMTDANADGIWETTLTLQAGTYEYKFSADGWGSQETLAAGTSCTVTNNGYTNRALNLNANTTLDVVCWGSCVNCAPPTYPVTFRVDMANQTGFTTPEVNGTFNGWCGNCNPLTDANADGVWETTLNLPAGTYEYKFAADAWTTQENLTAGSSCTVTNSGYTNRALTVGTAAQTLPVVCWGSCTTCSAPTYNVTFKVDMTQTTGFTTPEVNGTFNGWCGNCTPMTDANADGVWEVTVALLPGTYEYKFSADGWGIQENLTAGTACTVTNFGYTNRSLTVGTSAQVLGTVCWNSCSACVIATPGCTNATAANYNAAATVDNGTCVYATNFNVDMTCAGTYTNVYITGPWCGWCGADTYNLLSDANADGIYNVTVNLPAGNVEYKYMVDNWASQENLVDDMQNGGTCAPVTDYANYANRQIVVGTTTNDVYGRCSACLAGIPGCIDVAAVNYNPIATYTDGSCLYATQFNVDMNCAGTAFTNVYVTGPWCGWCGADTYNHLTDSNSDGIYTVTVNLAAGNVEYKYMVDNWASQENLVDDMQNGGSCAPVTDYANYANRQSPTGQVKNDVYGRCSACPVLGCTNATACNYNALATQDDASCTFATTWYLDADADGYYASSTSNCTWPGVGYTSTAGTSGDCNDNNASVHPGVTESCSTAFDDNCNGQINEGCSAIAGDNPSNATSVATSIWPNCSASNGTLVGAGASSSAQTICLTGEDKWHQFVATSEGVSIAVNSSSNDIVIELQTAAGVLVAQENAVAGLGGEILNQSGLTAGQVYKVGVRNYNSSLGIGSYTICVKTLKRGGCDYGAGPYTLCQYFKASYAGATGVTYTYTFTGTSGPAAGNVYTRTQNSDICVLSNVTPILPYGSTFNLLITNTYTLTNAAGTSETVTVSALAPCSVSTSAQPTTTLRTSDQCTSGQKFRGATVASLPWVCGATNWRWKFQELDVAGNPVGLPIEISRNAASNYLTLSTVTQLQYGKTYAVQTAPILAYTGTNYAFGPAFNMCIIGAAGMVVDGSQDAAQGSTKDAAQVVSQEMELSVYPNPSNGNNIQMMLSGIDAETVQVRMLDAMGKEIWTNKYNTLELSNTSIEFEQQLADGIYFIQIVSGKQTISQRFLVRK